MQDPEEQRRIRGLVRDQYEDNPYPAPQPDIGEFVDGGTFLLESPAHHFHWYWPFRKKNLAIDVLVAGCGTEQAAQLAVQCPEARFTAIDISRKSLDHTHRLVRENGLTNVEIIEMPVEDVTRLGRRFDLVVCTGVLHHLPVPEAGLAALRDVLSQSGSLFLMLYGCYGRDGVYLIQELFRRVGVSAADAGPALCAEIRKLLQSLPATHPMAARMDQFVDWKSDAGLVDLFLHPQDQAYSIADIYRLLSDGGMAMQKLLFRAHYAPRCSGLSVSPFMQAIGGLGLEEQFAIGELYRAAVKKHSFIACRADRDPNSYEIVFQGPAWKDLVPVRTHGLSIQPVAEGGAWISWPLHHFRDIRIPVDPTMLAIVQAVDGVRSISDIQNALCLGLPGGDVDEFLREFFSAMYDFDFMYFRGPVDD